MQSCKLEFTVGKTSIKMAKFKWTAAMVTHPSENASCKEINQCNLFYVNLELDAKQID